MICIGIDPGLDGAVAFLYPDGRARVDDLPTIALESGYVHRALDAPRFYHVLATNLSGSVGVVLREHVQTIPGSRRTAEGSLMRTIGAIDAVLQLAQLRTVDAVAPQRWKRAYGLIGKNKGTSLDVARTMFPSLAAERLARKKDHNRAEALLLAHYLRRTIA